MLVCGSGINYIIESLGLISHLLQQGLHNGLEGQPKLLGCVGAVQLGHVHEEDGGRAHVQGGVVDEVTEVAASVSGYPKLNVSLSLGDLSTESLQIEARLDALGPVPHAPEPAGSLSVHIRHEVGMVSGDSLHLHSLVGRHPHVHAQPRLHLFVQLRNALRNHIVDDRDLPHHERDGSRVQLHAQSLHLLYGDPTSIDHVMVKGTEPGHQNRPLCGRNCLSLAHP